MDETHCELPPGFSYSPNYRKMLRNKYNDLVTFYGNKINASKNLKIIFHDEDYCLAIIDLLNSNIKIKFDILVCDYVHEPTKQTYNYNNKLLVKLHWDTLDGYCCSLIDAVDYLLLGNEPDPDYMDK